MTDKKKILAFVDKLLEKYPKNYYLLMVAEFIDSLPEEPVSSVWHDTSEEPRVDEEILVLKSDGGVKQVKTYDYGTCKNEYFDGVLWWHLSKQKAWCYLDDLLHMQEKPVSEDLEEAAWLYADKKAHLDKAVFTPNALEKERTRLSFDWYSLRETFKDGAQWQKHKTVGKAVEWLQSNIDSSMWLKEFREMLEEE